MKFKFKNFKDLDTKKKIQLGALFIIIFLIGSAIPSKFALTTTESVGHTLFFLHRMPAGEVLKKDYVLFEIKDPMVQGGKQTTIVKRVSCVEGETLRVKGSDYFCNGNELIARAKEKSMSGQALKAFQFDGTIPKGFVFVAGDNPNSYDSRYFGLVSINAIKAKAYPIF